MKTKKWKIIAIVLAGVFFGLAGYVAYASRAASYLSDEPSTCVNCHIMAPYYASWSHSSHSRDATCNDCHVPHDNALDKWFYKGKDGLRHAAIFTMRGEPQVIRATNASSAVIMANCVRCHEQLNTEFVKTGGVTAQMLKSGEGKACWDCHRNVPHGNVSSLSSAPAALVPCPNSNVPEWLKKQSELHSKTNKQN
ncbi:MAG: cytochrome c nitrite reductase small subunit [Dysgonamonadaceae bacterium]|jgi:cytochrome c nitrite reductase small subunit|nr:cytochrome c nitrite reductase small subunit [Dysgonamonadaceae bacterium]